MQTDVTLVFWDGAVARISPSFPRAGAAVSETHLIGRDLPLVSHHPPQAGQRPPQGQGQPHPQVPLGPRAEDQGDAHVPAETEQGQEQ